MLRMGRLKSNILYNLTYQILNIILPLITMPYLSRVLGVDGIGTYAFVFSVCYYFYIVVALGLANYGNRAIAQVKGDRAMVSKTFWSIYFMQLATGILVVVAYIVYLLFFVQESFKLYFISFSPFVISAVFEISWFFFGLTEFKFTAIRSCVIKIISVMAVFLFVKTENDLVTYFLIMAATHFVNNSILWTRVRQFSDFYRPNIREVVVHIRPNLVLFTATLALNIYRVIDKIMIKEISGVTQNGYYENADNIIQAALTAFSAVAIVMMPAVSNMVARGKQKETRILLRDSMQASMFLGFGMVFGLIAVGQVFAPIFFGAAYDETGVLIQLLAVTVVIAGWTTVIRSQYIIPHEQDKVYAAALVAGAVMNVICNLIFIPIYRARGAVIGTIAAELMSFAIQTAVAAKDIDVPQLLKDGCIFAVPGAGMAVIVSAFLHYVNHNLFTLLAAILIGVLTYCLNGIITFYLFDKNRMQYYARSYFQPMLRKR